jgi:hypothetical protein
MLMKSTRLAYLQVNFAASMQLQFLKLAIRVRRIS